MRLAPGNIDRLTGSATSFGYDREEHSTGIVHFGIGAFHRAHQAWYTDLAMEAGDRDWMIAGISLRSGTVAAQLNPQGGLYTLTERSEDGSSTRVVGAVRNVIVAAQPGNQAPSAAAMAPGARIVTFTVTEKGYCRSDDGSLDRELAAASFYPHLAAAMRGRMQSGAPGLTLLSCDNLSGNGSVLRRLMGEYLASEAPEVLRWFEAECTCPSSMVDRIVPATTAADITELERRIGVRDEAATFTEPFSQWVVEDRFAGPRPQWDKVGVQVVDDVAPYEIAKLRMLNGAHSALAYLGLERNHVFVHQAIADPQLHAVVEQLMRVEAATSFTPAAGQDLDGYADELIARFANPALQHRLIQIAMDGSQKIPQRWLETLRIRQERGQASPALLRALSAWLRHVRGDRDPVDDPQAERLALLWREWGNAGVARAMFGPQGLFAQTWQADAAALVELESSLS